MGKMGREKREGKGERRKGGRFVEDVVGMRVIM